MSTYDPSLPGGRSSLWLVGEGMRFAMAVLRGRMRQIVGWMVNQPISLGSCGDSKAAVNEARTCASDRKVGPEGCVTPHSELCPEDTRGPERERAARLYT